MVAPNYAGSKAGFFVLLSARLDLRTRVEELISGSSSRAGWSISASERALDCIGRKVRRLLISDPAPASSHSWSRLCSVARDFTRVCT